MSEGHSRGHAEANPWGPLEGPLGGSEDRKDVKTGSQTSRGTIWPWRRVVSDTPNSIGCHEA